MKAALEAYPDACAAIAAAGHEIAHHGYEHVPPSKLSRELLVVLVEPFVDIIVAVPIPVKPVHESLKGHPHLYCQNEVSVATIILRHKPDCVKLQIA